MQIGKLELLSIVGLKAEVEAGFNQGRGEAACWWVCAADSYVCVVLFLQSIVWRITLR